MKFKLIAGVILAGFTLLFIFQNVTVVDIRFLFWTLSIYRSLLMLSFFLIGLFLGWVLHGFSVQKRKKASKR